MQVCPKCQKRYTDESRFCEVDGAELREMPGMGSVLAGQFELKSIIGRGSMGTVYRGWQRGVDRDVAIKLLRPELVREAAVVRRFEREARSVARVQHANVVTVFFSGATDDGVPFLVMEFVDGQVLGSVLKTVGRLVSERAVAIARQIASGLDGAHAAGVVHRDLKPANVLLLPGDAVKIVDFGIAKVLQETGDKLSRTGRVFGTPRYISPEQAGGGKVDARSDIYSLGVILFRMVTGRTPFLGTGMQLLLAHAQDEPPAPREIRPELSQPLDQLILRAMKKDPGERFQSAREMAAALDKLRPTAVTKGGMGAVQRTLHGVAPGQSGATVPESTGVAPMAAPLLVASAAPDPQSLNTASQSFSDRTLQEAGIGGRRRWLLLVLVGLLVGGGAVGAVVLSQTDKEAEHKLAKPKAQPVTAVPEAASAARVPATAPPVDAMPDAMITMDAQPTKAKATVTKKRVRLRKRGKRPKQPDYYLLEEKQPPPQKPDVDTGDDDELE